MTPHFHRSAHENDRVVDLHEGAADRVLLLRVDPPFSRWLAARASHFGRKSKCPRWVNIRRSAGSRVIARTAATNMARVFVYASGLKRRPSWGFEGQNGEERDRDDEQRVEAGTADLLDRPDHDVPVIPFPPFPLPHLELLVGLLDDHDRRIDQLPHGDGECRPGTLMFGGHAERPGTG